MIKTCQTCGNEFHADDFEIEGVDLSGFLTKCDPCAEASEAKDTASRKMEEARLRYEGAVPKLYRQTDTNHPDYPTEAHEFGQKWAMGNRPPSSFWFGVIGPPGHCKTRILSQVLKRLIVQGSIPEWTTSTRFSWDCENMTNYETGKKSRYNLDRFLRAGVLVFDDLGKQQWTKRACSQFYDLLEYRNGHMLPLLWSSNDSLESLGNTIPEGPRDAIVDRLRGNSLILEL